MAVYIDTQKVRGSAQSLRNTNTKLRTKLEEIRGLVDMINTDEVYKSPASDRLEEKFTNMANKRFPEFESIVENYAKHLDDVAETHENLVKSEIANVDSAIDSLGR